MTSVNAIAESREAAALRTGGVPAAAPSQDPPPRLLFVCDFPPSNFRGGPVLISRLLSDYPTDRLTVVTGSHFDRISPPDGRLDCRHIVFSATDSTGRLGWGRLKSAADWFSIPLLALRIARVIGRHRIEAILTIADGHFFIAASLAARMTGTPYVLVMHDDWVRGLQRSSYLLGHAAERILRQVVRDAAHVYAVSPAMRDLVRTECGCEAELQLPAKEPFIAPGDGTEQSKSALEMVYAGTNTGAVFQSLQSLVEVVRNGDLGFPTRLTIYTMPVDEAWKREHGWDHASINVQGWLSQDKLPSALARADILFLPFSFEERERPFVTSSFPSKTADYLAVGRPILVFGPPYSSIVRYAREHGCAEIVDSPDLRVLAQAIIRLESSPDYRKQLGQRSLEVFRQNHDMVRQRAEFRATLAHVCDSRNGGG